MFLFEYRPKDSPACHLWAVLLQEIPQISELNNTICISFLSDLPISFALCPLPKAASRVQKRGMIILQAGIARFFAENRQEQQTWLSREESIMRTLMGISPATWLRNPPNPTSPGRELANFRPPVAVYEFKGPERFLRAAGYSKSRGGLANPWGGYWTPQEVLTRMRMRLDQYEGWLSVDELLKAVPAQYRALAAICRDWNDLSEIWELSLPSGEVLQGLVGRTREQPEYSHLDRKQRRTPMLAGGAEQVFFKVKNPFWVHRVSSL